MNAARKPVVEFDHVGDSGGTGGSGNLYLSDATGKVREFLVLNDVCGPAALSILPGLIRSMGSVRMYGLDRWVDPVGRRRDVAVLRPTVAPRKAGSRSHGPVR